MRRSYRRGFALTGAILLLAGCDNGATQDEQAPDEQTPTEQPDDAPTGSEGLDEEALQDPTQGQDVEDPNEAVEDGVYRGNGVILPVPDGWSVDSTALRQGVVAAISEDGTQQLTARAVDLEAAAEDSGQSLEFDALIDSVRQQVQQEAEVDEEVELTGAERAHRLTFLDLAAQQEGVPSISATIVLAEDADGLLGEFAFTATTDAYEQSTAELLLADAGFDAGSEPPALPQPQPSVPQGDGNEGLPEGG